MKARESHMPDPDVWESFFDPVRTLELMGVNKHMRLLVDIGTGYGTFAIPAADIVGGSVVGFDIDPAMVAVCTDKATRTGKANCAFHARDVFADGTGLADCSADAVLLFNILHCEKPGILVGEAHRILTHGGKLLVMHWNHDPSTPRGPSMDIRPTPEGLGLLIGSMGFGPGRILDLPPYHYGLAFTKTLDPNSASPRLPD